MPRTLCVGMYLIFQVYIFKTNYEGAEAKNYNPDGFGFLILGDVNDHGVWRSPLSI